jgi:hypothetical protein
MLTEICGIDGFHVADMMPSGGCVKIDYFLPQIMDPLLEEVFPEQESNAL